MQREGWAESSRHAREVPSPRVGCVVEAHGGGDGFSALFATTRPPRQPLSVTLRRPVSGPATAAAAIPRVHLAPVAANDIRVLPRGHVIMPAAHLVVVDIEIVERFVLA